MCSHAAALFIYGIYNLSRTDQIKEIEKRCIQNAEHMESSLASVGCVISPEPRQLRDLPVSTVEELIFSEEFLALSTAAEQLEFMRQKLKG